MYVLSIGLVWVELYGKMEEKHKFWVIFEGWYQYQTEWYQYHKCSVILFRTSVRTLTITWSLIIRFEWFKLLVKLDFKEN